MNKRVVWLLIVEDVIGESEETYAFASKEGAIACAVEDYEDYYAEGGDAIREELSRVKERPESYGGYETADRNWYLQCKGVAD